MWSSSSSNKRIKLSSSQEEDESLQEAGQEPFIPAVLWDSIVTYLEVPELATCAQVSKEMHAVVMKDKTWEAHVKELLGIVFDKAFYIERKESIWWKDHLPVPISERPLKSTNFRVWYEEWTSSYKIEGRSGDKQSYCRTWDLFRKSAVRGKYYDPSGNEVDIRRLTTATAGEDCRWLVEDVPLRTYYKQAAEFAYLGYRYDCDEDEADISDMDEEDYYYHVSGINRYDYDGVLLGPDHEIFQGMPNIRLFRGLAPRRFRYASPEFSWEYCY